MIATEISEITPRKRNTLSPRCLERLSVIDFINESFETFNTDEELRLFKQDCKQNNAKHKQDKIPSEEEEEEDSDSIISSDEVALDEKQDEDLESHGEDNLNKILVVDDQEFNLFCF